MRIYLHARVPPWVKIGLFIGWCWLVAVALVLVLEVVG